MTSRSDDSFNENEGAQVSEPDQRKMLAEDRERLLDLLADERKSTETQKRRRAAAERELRRTIQDVQELRQRVTRLEGSAEYQLGRALARARRSPRAALALPRAVLRARSLPSGAAGPSKNALARDDKKVYSSVEAATRATRATELDSVRTQFAAEMAAGDELRIAGVVDDFTRKDLSSAATFVDVEPGRWEDQLEEFRPNLLFVESAWRGREDSWYGAVARLSETLQAVLGWCRENGVPTVFWAKEDPIHMHQFIHTAGQFDFVFTTDLDCVPRYKKILGHDRVNLLPFATQPAAHNPIETHDRIEGIVFAGSYYRKFPERTRDLEAIFRSVSREMPFDIYDRNFGLGRMEFAFPPEFLDHVKGTLPPEQVEVAYKGYRFSLNLNTIKQSQTMFARRVFELLASNTLVVSNYSRGMTNFFGELVTASDSGEECLAWMRRAIHDVQYGDALRLAGLRKVMREHTYADRIRFITSTIAGTAYETWKPKVSVVAATASSAEADAALAAAERQQGVVVHLTLVGIGPSRAAAPHVALSVTASPGAEPLTGADLVDTTAVAFFHHDDWYGPNYLLDLAITWRYADPTAAGKACFARREDDRATLVPGGRYTYVSTLAVRRAAIAPSQLSTIEWDALAAWIENGNVTSSGLLGIDHLNYCEHGADLPSDGLRLVSDLDLDIGIELADMLGTAAALEPAGSTPQQGMDLSGRGLHGRLRRLKKEERVTLRRTEGGIEVSSSLPDGETADLRSTQEHLVLPNWPAGELHAHLEATVGLRLRLTCTFLDHTDTAIATETAPANTDRTFIIPTGAVKVRLGVVVQGTGTATVMGLLARELPQSAPPHLPSAKTLLITDQYPSHTDLYSNGFVHTRVKAYRDHGTRAEVFALRSNSIMTFDSFEGINTMRGPKESLRNLVRTGGHDRILVHFLTPQIWAAIKGVTDKPIIVWIHGYEIQPWWRRAYPDLTPAQLEKNKQASARRIKFWNGVIADAGPNLHFVFVSRHFAEEVMDDLGVRFQEGQYSIIHNPIDTDLFAYAKKTPDMRHHVLSIRPYASPKYANDLTVAAILELQTEPWFSQLKFTLVGDGPLFPEITEPLAGLDNVALHRGFLTQPEIAELHERHGVFLSPTRMDAQGVSRDEAMSSGLVPVTSAVAAVPEFVDSTCGFLAPAEDASGLADAIRELHAHPELFSSLSEAAAARVRQQSELSLVIQEELALMGPVRQGKLGERDDHGA